MYSLVPTLMLKSELNKPTSMDMVLFYSISWLHGTVVERRSLTGLTGELFLSCARPTAYS